MLIDLHIENFAIIERLDLEFDPGLIAFTGETGAGKSIVVDALEMILGGRADTTFIRSDAERANVEGTFRIPETNRAAVNTILEREDLLEEPEYITLGREIRQNGRSTARVNGRSVNTSLLREIGEQLVDIHGQSEHLSLLRVNQHLGLLDRFAGVDDLVASYRKTYNKLQEIRHELADLRQSERDAARRIDMLTYQITEIESAHLKPGEDEALLEERTRLANAEGLSTAVQAALLALDEGTPESPSATDLFGQVSHALHSLARLDPSQSDLEGQGAELADGLAELARSLRLYLENIEFNPKRLDQVEERLALIQSLKRKYGDSIQAVLAFSEDAHRQLDTITHAGERIQELETAEMGTLAELGHEGEALSRKRKAEAEKMARLIESELVDLHMTSARFTVDFQRRPDPQGVPDENGERVAFDASGLERVEFLIAPNPGEGFKPLVKIASGGETSRLMLALKNVLASADRVPTLIFDEIDQGIGGRVGGVVGQKLWKLARQHQVLCITHLPQLAVFGGQHFQVLKEVRGGRTTTKVRNLEGETRLIELAQMFGEVSEGTLQSAREMMQAVTERTAPA